MLRRRPSCAAASQVYSPMRRYGISGTSRVGVIGIGGLGHLAIAIGKALGAEIVAFSSSADKREQALRMGAHHYVGVDRCSRDQKLGARLDLIISTVHARLDWVTYLQALRPNGVLCLLGGGTGILSISQQALLGQRTITTGEIGSRAAIARCSQSPRATGSRPRSRSRRCRRCSARSIACGRTRSATGPFSRTAKSCPASSST